MTEIWPENGECTKPTLYSFITLRMERFGALLFNPYLSLERQLDPVQAYIARLCNGRNSCRQIETAVRRRFGLSDIRARKHISGTVNILLEICALTFRGGEEEPGPQLPDTVVFPKNAPPISAPKNVVWDVTYACNLQCAHCLTSSGSSRDGELNTKQALSLIDKLAEAELFSLSLSGGEPFLRPDLLTLLRHIAGTRMRIDIATNGLHLPSSLLKSLRDLPVFQVQVSIDGIGEQHDQLRGHKGSFEAACSSIQRLQEEGIVVSVSTTVTLSNVNNLNQIIDLALKLGCSGFKAIPFLPAGRGRLHEKELQLDAKAYLQLSQTLVRRSEELRGQMSISTETTFAFLLGAPQNRTFSNGPMGCSAGYDTISIGADGTVYPCPFLQEFPLGNLMRNSLKSIWKEAPILKKLRNLDKQDIGDPCCNCNYAPLICRGGCRAAAYLDCGNLLASDPTCFKSII